ncbi:MAG: OsmC family protein [Bacteroidota bacterium]
MNDKPLLEYGVSAERLDAHGSLASCKEAELLLDTDVDGRVDAFNPAELLLAALAGCMIKGIERVTPMLHFQLRGVQVVLRGLRQDAPPRMAHIEYTLTIDTDESDRRLELLHQNVIKYGTVYNTLAAGTELAGKIRRAGGSNR